MSVEKTVSQNVKTVCLYYRQIIIPRIVNKQGVVMCLYKTKDRKSF
jgi:hypothetical protein